MSAADESHEDLLPPPPLSIVALDDDADFRQYIQTVLEEQGHDVRTCATPDELYAVCEEAWPSSGGSAGGGGGGPDVVLLDIKMGRSSGEEVLAELRRRWPRLCVVVVTGYPSLESMRQTFKQDVFDYLAKPFSLEELERTLAQAAAALGLGQRPQDRLRQELGRQIRLARAQMGWTLKELSERSEVSVSQLSSIERGSHLPSVESLLAVAGALEAKPSAWLAAAGF